MNTGIITTIFAILLFGISSSYAEEAVTWYAAGPTANTQFPNLAIRKKFVMLDEDNNGVITRSELAANPNVVRDTHLYGIYAFDTADFDKDGSLSKAEFSAFETPLPAE